MRSGYCGSSRGTSGRDELLRVEGQERQVEEDSEPVAINDEEEGQEAVDSGLGDDVGVKTVAQVNRVDVVTANERTLVSDSRTWRGSLNKRHTAGRRKLTIPGRCT